MVPEQLYKYISLKTPYVKDMLTKPELHFTAPGKFPDIFDCRPYYTFDKGTPEALATWYPIAINALVANDPRRGKVGDGDLTKEYKKTFPTPTDGLIGAAERILDNDTRNKRVGVLCLTATPDNPVMFAQYADQHQGICLRFQTRADSFLVGAEPVEYSENCPRVEFFDDSDHQEQ